MQPVSLVGTWRRFGAAGPVYEVIGVARTDASGEAVLRIRVLESGEEADYRMADVLDDPRER